VWIVAIGISLYVKNMAPCMFIKKIELRNANPHEKLHKLTLTNVLLLDILF